MDKKFVSDRITTLLIQEKLSEYELSSKLGHSKSYINNITSGKSLPSLQEFLHICDCLKINPSDFFAEDNASPIQTRAILEKLSVLDENDLKTVLDLVDRLAE